MAFRKQQAERESVLDLEAEIKLSNGDLDALMSQLLERGKEFEAARASFMRRSENPRNLTSRPQLVAKADEAATSKQRCDQTLHALMHKVRAPGMKPEDWRLVEKTLRGTRKIG